MILHTIKRSDFEANHYEAWNAYIDIVAYGPPEELTETQQHAHFASWYDSELQNGGHLQYFENQGITNLNAALRGLEALEATSQRDILAQAENRWLGVQRRKILTVAEYVAKAREAEFDDLDLAYYRCKPDMTKLLEQYLAAHFAEFIELQ
jgi:hypothetical protein